MCFQRAILIFKMNPRGHCSVALLRNTGGLWVLSVLALAIAVSASDAQERQKPNADVPAAQAFSPIFARIWSLSLENDPFQSVRGQFDPTMGGWRANLAFPGTSSCLVSSEIQGRRLAGTNVRLPVYSCTFDIDPDESKRPFERFVQVVMSLNQNWRTMPDISKPIPIIPWRSSHDYASKPVTFVSRGDEGGNQQYKPQMCYQPRHLSISWTKAVDASPPYANLGIQIFPPSTSPSQHAACADVY
jgi:hypothetical protein